MSPEKFKAPFITNAEIEKRLEELRQPFKVCRRIPVDVLSFAEFDLKLQFSFADIRRCNQDAVLLPDLSGIVFDSFSFTHAPYHQRVRFSAAHELGHFFLHREVYGSLNFTTIKQWIAFINAIPAAQYFWIEKHADEFAGRLLMPNDDLSRVLNETVADAEREDVFSLGLDEVLDFCSRAMHNHFGVSFPAMQTRIRKSEFWPHKRIPKDISN